MTMDKNPEQDSENVEIVKNDDFVCAPLLISNSFKPLETPLKDKLLKEKELKGSASEKSYKVEDEPSVPEALRDLWREWVPVRRRKRAVLHEDWANKQTARFMRLIEAYGLEAVQKAFRDAVDNEWQSVPEDLVERYARRSQSWPKAAVKPVRRSNMPLDVP